MSEVQTRILNHMNKDHKLAIEDYLAVYGDVIINDKIANIKMKTIELDHFDISFNHFDIEFEIVKPIAIDPPMKDLRESREKLVDMAKYAANKRGFSHIQIQDIIYPTAIWEYAFLALVAVCFIGAIYPTLVYPYFLDQILPSTLAKLLRSQNKLIAILTVVTHIIEWRWLLAPKLNYYRVPTDFRLEWIAFCLLDGSATVRRFNKLIAQIDKKH